MAQVSHVETSGQGREGGESVVRISMAEACQVIEQRFRQHPLGAQSLQAAAALTLGEGRATLPHDQREVSVPGCLQAQYLQDQQLARCIGQVIFAAQHVSHVHERVVYRVAEEERGAAIGTENDEVPYILMRKSLTTTH